MKHIRGIFSDYSVLFFVTLLGLRISPAQENAVSSETVGFNKIVCMGGSDTVISVPFHRNPAFSGKIGSAPSVAGSTITITPDGPNLADDAFTDTPHYLRFRNGGALAGAWYEVTANDAASITIDVGNDDASGLQVDDPFDIIPHWTLEKLLPKDSQEAMYVSDGYLPTDRQSRLLFADVTSDGIKLAPNRIYFLTTDGWFQATSGFPASEDVVVSPGQVIVVRHPEGAEDTTFYAMDHVHQHDHYTPLRTRTDGPQDNTIGLVRPVPVSLSELDLDSSVFIDSISNDIADRKDELLIYDNLTAPLNKQPAFTYFRVGGEWRLDDGNTYPVSNDSEIPPSTAIVIRKTATVDGATLVWINSPRY